MDIWFTLAKFAIPPFFPWALTKSSCVRITSPIAGAVLNAGNHTVQGTYRWNPWLRYRLFRNQGKLYWPQGSPDFDHKRRSWRCNVNIGGTPGREHTIIVAAVSPELNETFLAYYSHVGEKHKLWVPGSSS